MLSKQQRIAQRKAEARLRKATVKTVPTPKVKTTVKPKVILIKAKDRR